MAWLRKKIRTWQRSRASRSLPEPFQAVCGTAHFALCRPGGVHETPPLRTMLRAGIGYSGVWDTEIRGYLDGTVKLERNVATQYHVRIGCESSKPDHGRYEVMRLLQRWDLSSIPPFARVHTATLTLVQEDITRFPHRHPLVWPVDIYLYQVRRPWGPGRGGINQDNQSAPEAGDAWWLQARHGEESWRAPGCGFASDTDADADRGAEPLASDRLISTGQDLVLGGPRLASHVEQMLREGRPLDLLLKAGDALEARPGSIRAFYSRELGDDICPRKRPCLEVTWSAQAAYVESKPFVLEPGTAIVWSPGVPAEALADARTCVSWTAINAAALEPAIDVIAASEPGPAPVSVRISAEGFRLRAGETLSIPILETWTPDVSSPQALEVAFELTSPSGRTIDRIAQHVPPFTFSGEIRPDELGLWRYSWRTCPDRRFPDHTGSGAFTVVPGEGEAYAAALRDMVEGALFESEAPTSLADRRRLHYRLSLLVPELRAAGSTDLLSKVGAVLSSFD